MLPSSHSQIPLTQHQYILFPSYHTYRITRHVNTIENNAQDPVAGQQQEDVNIEPPHPSAAPFSTDNIKSITPPPEAFKAAADAETATVVYVQSPTAAEEAVAAIATTTAPTTEPKQKPAYHSSMPATAAGGRVQPIKGASRYRGVSWNKNCKKWRAQVWKGNEVFHIGYFDDEVSAAKAYDEGVLRLRGDKAATNFPADDYNVLFPVNGVPLHPYPPKKRRKSLVNTNTNTTKPDAGVVGRKEMGLGHMYQPGDGGNNNNNNNNFGGGPSFMKNEINPEAMGMLAQMLLQQGIATGGGMNFNATGDYNNYHMLHAANTINNNTASLLPPKYTNYHGVNWCRTKGVWISQYFDGVRYIQVGEHDNDIEAARKHDLAVLRFRGAEAASSAAGGPLNFALSSYLREFDEMKSILSIMKVQKQRQKQQQQQQQQQPSKAVWDQSRQQWYCEIEFSGDTIPLGYFSSEQDANEGYHYVASQLLNANSVSIQQQQQQQTYNNSGVVGRQQQQQQAEVNRLAAEVLSGAMPHVEDTNSALVNLLQHLQQQQQQQGQQ